MRKKEKKKLKLKILYFIIPLFLIAGAAAGAYFYVNGKIYVPTKDNLIDPSDKEAAQFEEEKGIINILLVGLDGRKTTDASRTDSIILASIDTNNKKVKLVSFMRDMYVPIPGYKDNRINTAFFLGGPELLMKTLNQDFGVSAQYYISIDFRAFQQLVDQLGGVNIEIKDYEIKEINKYINEINGSKSTLITNPGFQQLDGQQALSYCRIRKVGNNDFERTERQRRVLGELISKAKKTSFIKLPELFNVMIQNIKTNIPTTKLMNIGYTVYKFGSTTTDTLRIPGDGMFEGMKVYGMAVLVPDLEKNMNYLDKFISSTGNSVASNMPVYMVNNFHSDDKAVDKRGKAKSVPKIVIPKAASSEKPPEGVIVDKNEDSGIVPGETTGNTGEVNNGENSGNTDNGNNTGGSSGTQDNGGGTSGGTDNGTTNGGTDNGTTNGGTDSGTTNGGTDSGTTNGGTGTSTDSGTTNNGSETSGGN